MKKILSVLLSCILMLSMTTTASMAYTSSEISTVSDEQLLKKIVDKDTDVVYSGDKKLKNFLLKMIMSRLMELQNMIKMNLKILICI